MTGAARVVLCAPKIALALGYDVEDALEQLDPLRTLRVHTIGMRKAGLSGPIVAGTNDAAIDLRDGGSVHVS